MLDANLNQKQLAEVVGVSRATINNVSCGRSCSDKTAYGIADALNVELKQIIEYTHNIKILSKSWHGFRMNERR